jgi:type VI protein secretion system component Hcp
MTVVRQVDGASPLLLTALVSNSVLREVSILSLFDTTVDGKPMTAGYNQVLSSVKVANIETHATAEGVIEKLTFKYDKLLSYFSDGNSSTIANWGTAAPR